ncbi:hypothetical protein LPJ59_000962 [Coemansia sp. RSA 2399]|nr:hypothetical protein LPJ59_000962 [Coemansia sp. RSA 2399]
METAYSSSTTTSTPDVWQQLNAIQFGASLTKLFDYIAFVPIIWEESTTTIKVHSIETSTLHSDRSNIKYGSTATFPNTPAAETFIRPSRVISKSSIGVVPTNPGTQLFGLFVSPYFLFSIFIGFVISRIHVMVHRQRVRPIGLLARVAIYAPIYALLLRTIAIDCVALSGSPLRQHVHPWMQTTVDFVSKVVQRYGIVASDGPIESSRSLWLSFSACCIFDCIDVFVARLEGSPCAPYEYIGGLIESTSLYYFYGGSFRIQELGLLHVLEKLLLSHTLMLFESGWRWRLIPTGIANVLMLHHFLFSVRNYTGSYSVYPFVQVLSMALLGVSLVIVSTTVLIRWLASTVDKLGMKPVVDLSHRETADAQDPAGTALYDHNGVFQGTRADEANDEMFELMQDMFIPVVPDLRRDFSVEILDLAGTCLQRCSNKIQKNGYSRPFGAMRLPKTTALDQYVDNVVRANREGRQQTPRQITRGSRVGGLNVLVDDEPSAFGQIPGNSIDLVHALHGTRLNSIRNLSLGMWALSVALFRYALRRKVVPDSTYSSLNSNSAGGDLSNPTGVIHARMRAPRHKANRAGGPVNGGTPTHFASDPYSWIDSDEDDDDYDFDYVSGSEQASGVDDDDDVDVELLFNEVADLVDDVFINTNDMDPDNPSAPTATFIAHSLFNGGEQESQQRMMTRGVYARSIARDNNLAQPRLNVPVLFKALANMFRIASSSSDNNRPALPFERHETEALAELIRSRRQTNAAAAAAAGPAMPPETGTDSAARAAPPSTSESEVMCVVCWVNTRCVMLRPCRCLCMCNECRIALAARNFGHCPCCRRDVVGYSRVYAV